MLSVAEAGEHLLVVVAHPDDESFGCGSVIAGAVARGARVSVCCASLGEAGETAPGFELAGRSLAEVRGEELFRAAAALGARCLPPLGFADSGWDGPPRAGSICAVPPDQLVAAVGVVLHAERPDAVVTLAGDDGHRDHVRVAAAVETALGATAGGPDDAMVRPGPRLYRWCLPNELMRRWAEQMARLRPDTAHLALQVATLGTPAERITDVVDATAHLGVRRGAMAAHASQTSPYDGLSADLADAFLSRDHLVRVA